MVSLVGHPQMMMTYAKIVQKLEAAECPGERRAHIEHEMCTYR